MFLMEFVDVLRHQMYSIGREQYSTYLVLAKEIHLDSETGENGGVFHRDNTPTDDRARVWKVGDGAHLGGVHDHALVERQLRPGRQRVRSVRPAGRCPT